MAVIAGGDTIYLKQHWWVCGHEGLELNCGSFYIYRNKLAPLHGRTGRRRRLEIITILLGRRVCLLQERPLKYGQGNTETIVSIKRVLEINALDYGVDIE
jgi:hypothetical protein